MHKKPGKVKQYFLKLITIKILVFIVFAEKLQLFVKKDIFPKILCVIRWTLNNYSLLTKKKDTENIDKGNKNKLKKITAYHREQWQQIPSPCPMQYSLGQSVCLALCLTANLTLLLKSTIATKCMKITFQLYFF